jgi:hypothetical protein
LIKTYYLKKCKAASKVDFSKGLGDSDADKLLVGRARRYHHDRQAGKT